VAVAVAVAVDKRGHLALRAVIQLSCDGHTVVIRWSFGTTCRH